jgi:hypothetical protein
MFFVAAQRASEASESGQVLFTTLTRFVSALPRARLDAVDGEPAIAETVVMGYLVAPQHADATLRHLEAAELYFKSTKSVQSDVVRLCLHNLRRSVPLIPSSVASTCRRAD